MTDKCSLIKVRDGNPACRHGTHVAATLGMVDEPNGSFIIPVVGECIGIWIVRTLCNGAVSGLALKARFH